MSNTYIRDPTGGGVGRVRGGGQKKKKKSVVIYMSERFFFFWAPPPSSLSSYLALKAYANS